jgi:hypothetical protein
MSGEKRPKAYDDVIDSIGHPQERWSEHCASENLRLSEDYLNVQLHILVHFRVGNISKEFVAFFQRAFDLTCIDREDTDFVQEFRAPMWSERSSQRFSLEWTNATRYMRSTDSNQHAVLIDVVKAMESPEKFIPTFVWFESVDRFYRVLPHTLYFSRRFGVVPCGVFGNGEVDVPSGLDTSAANDYKLVSQVVQGTPEILDNITHNQTNVARDLLDGRGNIIDQLSRLRIALCGNYIWLGRCSEKRADFNMQVTDVLLGPLNFRTDKSESFVSCHGGLSP